MPELPPNHQPQIPVEYIEAHPGTVVDPMEAQAMAMATHGHEQIVAALISSAGKAHEDAKRGIAGADAHAYTSMRLAYDDRLETDRLAEAARNQYRQEIAAEDAARQQQPPPLPPPTIRS